MHNEETFLVASPEDGDKQSKRLLQAYRIACVSFPDDYRPTSESAQCAPQCDHPICQANRTSSNCPTTCLP